MSSSTEKQFDHGKVECVRVKSSETGDDIVLDFPVKTLDSSELPEVTVITVTGNRRSLFPLAIDNWKRMYYPHNKIKWLVIDDSQDMEQSPVRDLKSLKDDRIMFYYLSPKNDNEGKPIKYTIGYKRNLGMSLIKSEYAVMMDDDDYLYDESVLARICCLKYYGKGLVYSAELAIYNIQNERSYIVEDAPDISEASILLTKTFWEKTKFSEGECGEGMQLVAHRELECIKIPFYFNFIVLQHKRNFTGKNRNMRFTMTGKYKQASSTQGHMNFFKIFSKSFQSELKKLM